MKYKFILLIGILSVSLIGCDKTFLDTEDKSSISSESYPTSLKDFDILIASVYGAQHHLGLYGMSYLPFTVYNLDHTTDLQWRLDPAWNSLNDGLGVSVLQDWELLFQWKDINSGVYYCNVVLDAILKYRDGAPQNEAKALDNLEGECLFMRSYFRWHLQVLFGQPNLEGMGIPIIDKMPESLSAMNVPRETTRDSYQAMINDFKAATVLLQGQSDQFRPTVWSAKAALGKTYFFAEKYDSARLVLLDCINNSGKTLVSLSAYKKMFNGEAAYEHNSESFYEAEMIAQPNLSGQGPFHSSEGIAGSSMPMLYAPYYIDPEDDQRKACSWSNMYMHDRNLARFGYTDITFLSAVSGQTVDPVYEARQIEFRKGNDYSIDPDPRLYIAALQPWIDTIMIEGKPMKVAQSDFGVWYEMDPAINDPATYYGWPLNKHNFTDGLFAETQNVSGSNMYFIRLPEIYLMYAEIIKTTDPATALEYVNKVHRRAWGYDPNGSSPVDYSSLADATKAPSDDELLHNNPLLFEKWAEFFAEGKWWEEVKRLQIGAKESEFYKTCSGGIPIGWSDTQYAMPIPNQEFETNTNPGMIQNPGPWN